MKSISDEQIIAALMAHNTVAAAAAAVGLSVRAMYDRMNDSEFKVLYRAAKADIVNAAVGKLNEKVAEAIDTIAGIMADKEVNAAVRLQAATAMLTHAEKFTDRAALAEAHVLGQIQNNKWKMDF